MTFARIRDIAHNAVSVVGVLAAFQGLVVAFLAQLGLQAHAAQASYVMAGVGAGAALLSKLIDAVTNALTSSPSSPTPAPAAPAPAPPTPLPPTGVSP